MRQVAHHVWIQELLEGDYEEKEGWEPNILHTGRGDVSRVNLIGTVLSINGQTVLDDGTGQLTLRAFEEVPGLKAASSGQMSLVLGRPRKYQGTLYLIPEVVRAIDPGWALVRKRELGPVIAPKKKVEAPTPVVEEISEPINKAERLVMIINGLDKGSGASIEDAIEESGFGKDAEKIIDQLLLDGEIFEIRPGVVKVL